MRSPVGPARRRRLLRYVTEDSRETLRFPRIRSVVLSPLYLADFFPNETQCNPIEIIRGFRNVLLGLLPSSLDLETCVTPNNEGGKREGRERECCGKLVWPGKYFSQE